MTSHASATELKTMQASDLQRELHELELSLEKMRLGVQLGKDKDSARYRRDKRQFARMKSEWGRKQRERLHAGSKPSTVPASKS
ncbi:MAG: hypothetical protein WCG83_01775 [Candidatus Peregrinibacteria bacterium]